MPYAIKGIWISQIKKKKKEIFLKDKGRKIVLGTKREAEKALKRAVEIAERRRKRIAPRSRSKYWIVKV